MSKLILSLLLLATSSVAFAYDYTASAAGTQYSYNGGNAPYYPTQSEACVARGPTLSSSDQSYYGLPLQWLSGNCMGQKTYNGATGFIAGVAINRCPNGGSLDTSVTPAMCRGGTPPPPPPCVGGLNAVYRYAITDASGANVGPLSGPNAGSANDGNSCGVNITGVRDCYATVGTKITWCYFDTLSTGAAASTGAVRADRDGPPATQRETADANAPATTPRVNPPPSKADAQGQCFSGMVQAGVDSGGTPICMGAGTMPTNAPPPPVKTTAPTVTTQNADGSSTTQTTTTTKNADGSTTTTVDRTVTGADGTKTVSQDLSTSANTNGDPGKASPATPPTPDLCTANPQLSICKNSSVTGSCGAISCTGDAIQCATLRAAAMMQCQQAKDIADSAASPLTSLGTAAASGNDPLKGTFPSAAGASVVQASSLDASGWLGGGACFADKVVTFRGQSITLPFSKSCDILLALRYALMVAAALVSFRILSGAILT